MSYFITYSQNGEDIMLRRALREVERGFYIDVGAQDPLVDSVTKAFYDQGWRGINIDPVQHWYEELCKDRPHDINLQVAISDQDGELKLFEVQDTGLSTTDRIFAWRHRAEGRSVIEYDVSAVTLDHICAEHGVDTVHFLKIDCEGAEKQALASIALKQVRPWIILVEATEPNSTKPTHEQWEHLLTGRGYQYVYTDGINRFYLADEHMELRPAFGWPPNILDYAMRAEEIRAHDHVGRLQHELEQATAADRVGRAEGARDFLDGENHRREEALKDHREALAALREQVGKLQGERDAGQAHAQTLIAENQRRETALEQHREALRMLQNAVDAHEAHIASLNSERDRLVAENERREAALQDHREALAALREQVGKLQGEREAVQAHAQTLLAENERRETALEQHREALDVLREQLGTLQGEREAAQAQVQRWISENEQREAALAQHRELQQQLQDTLQAHQTRLVDLTSERDQLLGENQRREATLRDRNHELAGLRPQAAAQAAEIARMQIEVRDMGAHIARLEAWQATVLHSISWHLSAPLRWTGRGVRAIARFFLALILLLARPFARVARPTLRRLAQRPLPRRLAIAAFGKRSRFTNTARVFLFGPPPVVIAPVAETIPQPVFAAAPTAVAAPLPEPPPPFVPQPMSLRERRVMALLETARASRSELEEKVA